MKFASHQTFYLRASWPYKGLSAIAKDSAILNKEKAMVELGIGKNMVASLRYWLEATQLVQRKNANLYISKIAQEILTSDPYFELDGTLQVIHYLLASNKKDATSWHWFFNKFYASEFDSESLSIYLKSYVSTASDKNIKDSTIAKDIACLLKMYSEEEYGLKNSPESNNPSIFSRFEWIKHKGGKYTRRNISSDEIEPLIFVFTTYLFWNKFMAEAESINIENIAGKENSPGRIFGLSLDKCLEIVKFVNRKYPKKYIEHSKSGGYFILNLKKFNARNALKQYYAERTMVS